MNLGGVSADYVNKTFTNHLLGKGLNTSWNVRLDDAFFGSFNVNNAKNTYAYINTASNLI